ncbi:MAG: Nif3-like dinuclear metal center hexameric protein [Prevotellaceae bacterium]|nr:Nif3-like dinuclear metal center hexameric protein [Prevotellaceae bacterium]
MTVSQIASIIEELAPKAYQESYDNTGLCVGSATQEVGGALLCLDVTEEIVHEAIAHKCNLIISHHPVIFGGLKQITGQTEQQRVVRLAIKNDIALYSAHTNIDSVRGGVSEKMADRLALTNRSILIPQKGNLVKLVTFAPTRHAEKVRSALFEAGAGHIGAYSHCSYNASGTGTFMAGEGAQPFVGKWGELRQEPEERMEVIVPEHLSGKVVSALIKTHPYEEPAFDLVPLANVNPNVGFGILGKLPKQMEVNAFLKQVKQVFKCSSIKYSTCTKPIISKVAVMSGSGAGFSGAASAVGADAYVSADFKYHELQNINTQLLAIDIGHYESEVAVIEIFYDVLTKKCSKFVVRLASSLKNPINYL